MAWFEDLRLGDALFHFRFPDESGRDAFKDTGRFAHDGILCSEPFKSRRDKEATVTVLLAPLSRCEHRADKDGNPLMVKISDNQRNSCYALLEDMKLVCISDYEVMETKMCSETEAKNIHAAVCEMLKGLCFDYPCRCNISIHRNFLRFRPGHDRGRCWALD